MNTYRIFEFIDKDGDIVRLDAPISNTYVDPMIKTEVGFFRTKEIIEDYCFGVRLTNGRHITWIFSNPENAVQYRNKILSAYLAFYEKKLLTLDLVSQ
jgi:hypothetical protein